MERKVIVFIATSIDGFIAAENDNLDFLSIVEQEGEDYGYSEFHNSIDTVIMGRKTYDKVLSFNVPFPHSSKQCYILTNNKALESQLVQYYSEDVETLIAQLKKQSGKNIFIDGGAQIVQLLLQKQLIDELIISVIPTIIGNGVKLFGSTTPQQLFTLVQAKSFTKGLVQLHYKKQLVS